MGKIRRPSPGLMARLGKSIAKQSEGRAGKKYLPLGGRVRKLRPVEDQSAPSPEEITSKLGGIILYSGTHSPRAIGDRLDCLSKSTMSLFLSPEQVQGQERHSSYSINSMFDSFCSPAYKHFKKCGHM